MFSHHALNIRLIFTYILAILLLPGFSGINAKAIPPQALDLTSNQFTSNRSHELFHGNRLDKRHEVFTSDVVAALEERGLVKRGNCFSTRKDTYTCSSTAPTVAECFQQVRSHGLVGSRISVFYTGLGGQSGMQMCKEWYTNSTCQRQLGDAVFWDGIVDNKWYLAQAKAIMEGNRFPNAVVDQFQKRLAQAFAEASAGDAYLCTPEENAPANNFILDTAWGGWEYPALTRNGNINKVIRVDPSPGKQETRAIWTRGQAPTANEPRG
ncbi:MAG: hypothetical protein Q9214_006958 [Letrouitia sp. 1 TL-2023]